MKESNMTPKVLIPETDNVGEKADIMEEGSILGTVSWGGFEKP